MFKTLKGSCLQDMFSFRGLAWVQYKKFRNTVKFAKATNKLFKTKLLLQGGILWNSLPQDIRKLQSFAQFKKAIAEYYSN